MSRRIDTSIDPRPDVRPVELMFVEKISDYLIWLKTVGSVAASCVAISSPIPVELSMRLIGRWVWVRGAWGDRAEIVKWVDLPEKPDQ